MPEENKDALEQAPAGVIEGVEEPKADEIPTPYDELKSFMDSRDLKSPDDLSGYVEGLGETEQWKKQYGDRLAIYGTIGIQTTMPFGTAEDVDREVKHMIETVGEGGGLIIAPTHVLEPEVPLDNIMAFLNAVDRYGHYV